MNVQILGAAIVIVLITVLEVVNYSQAKRSARLMLKEADESAPNTTDESTLPGRLIAAKVSCSLACVLFLFAGLFLFLKYLSTRSELDTFGVHVGNPLWWPQAKWIVIAALTCAAGCAVGTFMLLRLPTTDCEKTTFRRMKQLRWKVLLSMGFTVAIFPLVWLLIVVTPAAKTPYLTVKFNDREVKKISSALTLNRFDAGMIDTSEAVNAGLGCDSVQFEKPLQVTFAVFTSVSEPSVSSWVLTRQSPGDTCVDSLSGVVNDTLPCFTRVELAYQLCMAIGIEREEILVNDSYERSSKACPEIMEGWLAFSTESTTAIETALEHFERAIKIDSMALSAYAYAAYCCNLLLNRMCPPCSDNVCDTGLVFDNFRKRTEEYSAKYDLYISRTLTHLTNADNYVVLKVRADRMYNQGMHELASARMAELRGTRSIGLEFYYERARSSLLESRDLYVRALKQSPGNRYIKFNLGLCYEGLCEIELYASDSSLAQMYLALASLATKEAMGARNQGSQVRQAEMWFEEYQHFRTSDVELLDQADSIANWVVVLPKTVGVSPVWVFEGRVLRAAINLERFKRNGAQSDYLEKAISDLVEAQKLGLKDMCWVLYMDRDFDVVTSLLSERKLSKLDDLLKSIQDHNSISFLQTTAGVGVGVVDPRRDPPSSSD